MSENSATQTIWLTQEAYDKLRKELDHLSGPGRAAVTAKIASARDEGDLSENGGYHAAREEQAHQEARIRQLIDMLNRAQVGEAPANADEVAPGTQVTIAFDGDESDTDTFLLGSRELLGLDNSVDSTNVYSPQSPLGSAILGKKTGDAVSYIAPNGRSINVTVVKVEVSRLSLFNVSLPRPASLLKLTDQLLSLGRRQSPGGYLGKNFIPGQSGLRFRRLAEAELLKQLGESQPRGGIGNAKMLLHLSEIAPRREKHAKHLRLLLVEGTELTRAEDASQFRAARGATQADDRKLITAHRAFARRAVTKWVLRSA